MNVGDSLINTDFLRVARQRISEGQPHELYFNYLLLKLLTEVHSCTDVSVTSAFQDVHKDVEVLTGVVYSDLAVPIIRVAEPKPLYLQMYHLPMMPTSRTIRLLWKLRQSDHLLNHLYCCRKC